MAADQLTRRRPFRLERSPAAGVTVSVAGGSTLAMERAATSAERSHVEVKIGIQSVPRELVVETDTPVEQIERDLATALSADRAIFTLAAEKGGKVLVPAEKIAYVEFTGTESRRVGFGTTI